MTSPARPALDRHGLPRSARIRPGPPGNPAAGRRGDRAARLRSGRIGAGPVHAAQGHHRPGGARAGRRRDRHRARAASCMWTRSCTRSRASCAAPKSLCCSRSARAANRSSAGSSPCPRQGRRRLLMAEDAPPACELDALATRVPVVLIAGSANAAGLDAMTVDNAGGVRAAVTHLTGVHGYRRLCFVGGPPDSPTPSSALLRSTRRSAPASGCTAAATVHGDFSEASGSAAARALLARAAEPEAVVCANDQMAIGLLREFRRSGVTFPAGWPSPVSTTSIPAGSRHLPLTTVSQPLRELGTRAARRLIDRIGAATLPPADRGCCPPTWSSAPAAAARQPGSRGRRCGPRQAGSPGPRPPRPDVLRGSGRDRTDSGSQKEIRS